MGLGNNSRMAALEVMQSDRWQRLTLNGRSPDLDPNSLFVSHDGEGPEETLVTIDSGIVASNAQDGCNWHHRITDRFGNNLVDTQQPFIVATLLLIKTFPSAANEIRVGLLVTEGPATDMGAGKSGNALGLDGNIPPENQHNVWSLTTSGGWIGTWSDTGAPTDRDGVFAHYGHRIFDGAPRAGGQGGIQTASRVGGSGGQGGHGTAPGGANAWYITLSISCSQSQAAQRSLGFAAYFSVSDDLGGWIPTG